MKNIISLIFLSLFNFVFCQSIYSNPEFISEIKNQNSILKHIMIAYMNTTSTCNINPENVLKLKNSNENLKAILSPKTIAKPIIKPTTIAQNKPIVVQNKPILKPVNQVSQIEVLIKSDFPSIGNKLTYKKELTEINLISNESSIFKNATEFSSFGKEYLSKLASLLVKFPNYKLIIEVKDSEKEEREKKIVNLERIKKELKTVNQQLENRIEFSQEVSFDNYFNPTTQKLAFEQIRFAIKM